MLNFLRGRSQDVSATDDGLRRNVVLRPPAYQPIAERNSRLLRLSPGHWEEPITFDLVDYSTELGRLPFYEAVSYSWGDQTEFVPVTCSGREVDISLAVAALLRRLRLHDSYPYSYRHFMSTLHNRIADEY
jgi:hypothetical protein